MKLSVSVPDDLWDQARALDAGLNPSHLVQEALRRWVDRAGSKPAYSTTPPEDVQQAFESARDRFAEEARKEFERAYRKGVEVAARLDWSSIDGLAENFRFDVRRWAEAHAQGARQAELRKAGYESWQTEEDDPDVDEVKALIEGLGALAHPFGEEMWVPSPTYLRGFAQAMRDLWGAVSEGKPHQTAKEGARQGGESQDRDHVEVEPGN